MMLSINPTFFGSSPLRCRHLVISAEDGRELFAINADCSTEGELQGEAVQIFVREIAGLLHLVDTKKDSGTT